MLEKCGGCLQHLLSKLEAVQSHRFGRERFKFAFHADSTRQAIQDLCRKCQTISSMVSLDGLSLGVATHQLGVATYQGIVAVGRQER